MNLGTGMEADMGRARTDTAFRPPRPQSKIKKDSRTCNERSHTNRETADVEDKFAGKEEKNLLTDAVRQAGKEIDDLFNDLTQRKRVAAASATTKKAVVKIKKADSRPPSHTVGKNEGRRYDPQRDDPDVRPWKRDATGMPIYDPESMRVGKEFLGLTRAEKFLEKPGVPDKSFGTWCAGRPKRHCEKGVA